MKHLLLPSIIATLAVPAFATTPTTLPNNALCNETNLGTESGSADIEVVWEANTINTQWFTGYGENTAAASATTCEYGGTINLPQTNPSRPGYAFAGWKLRTDPTCGLSNVDTSLNGKEGSDEYVAISPKGYSSSTNLVAPGSWSVGFNYGTIKGTSTCNSTVPTNFETLIMGVANGTVSMEEFVSLWAANGDATRPSNTFNSASQTGGRCWCRITEYTPVNGDACALSSSSWVFSVYGDGSTQDCVEYCSQGCETLAFEVEFVRTAMFR